MTLLERYFHNTGEYENEFQAPAATEELSKLEKQLHFELPNDYKNFLLSSNGFEGFINEFFVRFVSVADILEYTRSYCSIFFPWAIFIGTDGGNEMLVIDKRQAPCMFGLLPYIADEEDFIPLGDTFDKLIQRLYNNTAFKEG